MKAYYQLTVRSAIVQNLLNSEVEKTKMIGMKLADTWDETYIGARTYKQVGD